MKVFSYKQSLETEVEADLMGRLAKVKDIKGFKEPMLEAIANSVQAIAQSGRNDGKIDVFLKWNVHPDLFQRNAYRELKSIWIQDNGPGFTDENMKSFKRLDSQQKAESFGCLGVGRLLWLKVFSDVEVTSIYKKNNKKRRRTFSFNIQDEVSNIEDEEVDSSLDTVTLVKLINIKSDFVNRRLINPDDVADTIMRHFLLLYALGKMPEVVVRDGETKVEVSKVYQQVKSTQESKSSEFEVCGNRFTFTQQRFNIKSTQKLSSGVYLCAGQRVVERREKGIDERVCDAFDGGSEAPCLYVGLVQGKYLDQHVNSTRKKIVFPNKSTEKGEEQLKFEDVEDGLIKQLNEHLTKYLEDELIELNGRSRDRLRRFVDNTAPEFKGFVNQFGDQLFVRSKQNDLQVWDYVNKKYFEYENKVRPEIDKLIQVDWDHVNVEKRIQEIEQKVEALNFRDLVRFSARRKFYLEMLKKAVSLKEDGKYQREKAVHSLIFPMRTDSLEPDGMDKQNLWLIDDRLAFSHYLASDKGFDAIPITDSDSRKRMDLAALKLYAAGDSTQPGELLIVEFKRPGRNDYDSDENPISQVMDYVENLRAGKITAHDGTEISNADRLPTFCYVIAQFTDKLRKQCRNSNFVHNALMDCYFGNLQNVYFEIMNFNSLYRKAFERNRAMLVAAHLSDPPAD